MGIVVRGAAAVLAAGLLATMPAPTMAQPSPAQAAAAVDFDIPPLPLDQAITRFAVQSRLQIVAPGDLTANRRSPGVRGVLAPSAALDRLLAGTGLVARFTDTATATLVAAPAAGGTATGADIVTLGAVTVDGRTAAPLETAWSPVDGFVATRSATGTKTDLPLIETPQTINVITRDQIDAQAAQTIGDALRYTAGVTKVQGFNRTDDAVNIRGFQSSASNLFRDGTRQQYNVYDGMAEPYALERIEVLKGPASVLYGQSAPGGVINLVTKRPKFASFGEVEVEGGNFRRKQAATDFGGNLDAAGTWSYRLTALARDSDTMVDYIPDNRLFVAPSLAWRPTVDTTLTFLGNYMKSKTVYNYGYPTQGTVLANPNGQIATSRFIGEPDYNKWDRTSRSIGYLFEHRFDEVWQVRQNFRYADYKNDYADVAFLAWQPGMRSITRSAYSRFDQSQNIALDNQAQADISTGPIRHTLLAGLDWNNWQWGRTQYSGTLGSLDLYNPVYGSAVRMGFTPVTSTRATGSQIGLYAQDNLKIFDRLILQIGGRQDWVDQSNKNRLTNVTAKQDDAAFTWRAGALYAFDSGVSPYVSYAESFAPATGTTYGGAAFQPTTGQQYEAGVKFEPRGLNASFTASVFDLKQQNVATPDLAHPGFSVQAGEVRSKGVELQAVASLTDRLDLVGAYTYTDAKVSKSNGADLGRRPAGVPQQMASLWLDYTIRDGMLAGLGFGGGGRYVGATWNTANNAQAPSYTVADALIRYDIGQVGLSLNAINLFDRDYVEACTYACFYGDRRTVIARLKYRW